MSTARFDNKNHLTSICAIKLNNRFFYVLTLDISYPGREQEQEGVIVGIYLSAMWGVLQFHGRDHRNT